MKQPAVLVRVCPFCKQTGHCGKCEGSGMRATTGRGRFNTRVKQEAQCHACEGSGVCQLCHGKGELLD